NRDQDYEFDEAKRTVSVLEEGIAKVEEILGIDNLYEQVNTPMVHHLNNAIRAKELYKRDVDYIVKNGEVLIVDEFTGRTLEGRRYSEGLHQAIEAKEGVRVREENQTLATITIQNYFRMYDKLGGMTGTAKTQAREFEEVYKLGVVEIPTNREMIREDRRDEIYKNEDAKWNAVTQDLVERHEKGQPVLVGTVSIEKSERLSGYLNRRGVPHNVLNAKNHEREATIVAQAGSIGAVTVATNMAGRGVDILLGGNPEYLARQEMAAREFDNDRYLMFEMDEEERAEYESVYEPIYRKFKEQTDAEHEDVVNLGGLYVLGTERHESRRIDNQLRGRSGRQGDPGESKFYLSLEDDLMRLFASDRIGSIMERLNWPEDEPITAKLVSRAIETAQGQVEGVNFERRKNILKYDEVKNTQRQIIYTDRTRILAGEDLKDPALEMVEEVITGTVAMFVNKEVFSEEWDLPGLHAALSSLYPISISLDALKEEHDAGSVSEMLLQDGLNRYAEREAALGAEQMRQLERIVLLNITDNKWREHLYEVDYLEEGIHLRAYGQKDPLVEFQREAYQMFDEMKGAIVDEFVRYIYRVELIRPEEATARRPRVVQTTGPDNAASGGGVQATGGGDAGQPQTATVASDKVPRNAPCPCGSGRKYKKCHGAVA
ncbi:MAG: SEC-C domain-containing protein, partial [Actinobacteria bacterium]|nr:SEC-C domain-containing protein [Actinomycetota bacterium]